MNNKAETRPTSRASAQDPGTAPKNGFFGAVRKKLHGISAAVTDVIAGNGISSVRGNEGNRESGGKSLAATVVRVLKTAAAWAAVFLLGWLFASAKLGIGGETRPLGLALLCAAERFLPAVFLGCTAAAVKLGIGNGTGGEGGLYLGAMLLAVGTRYAIGRFLTPDTSDGTAEWEWEREERENREEDGDRGGAVLRSAERFRQTAERFRRAVFPPGVFAQTAAVRVGISLAAAAVTTLGRMLGEGKEALWGSADDAVNTVIRALFFLCAVPVFTYAFCGISDAESDADSAGENCGTVSPALREAGICAFCFALTASMGGKLLFGLSPKLICAHMLTLYLSKKGGFLRGSAAGLCAGLACDVLYAPGYAMIGAVSGVLWRLHPAPAVVLSLCAGAAYAVYAGAFAAVRSVVPEMIVSAAAAYPLFRYLPIRTETAEAETEAGKEKKGKIGKEKEKKKRFSIFCDIGEESCGACAGCGEAFTEERRSFPAGTAEQPDAAGTDTRGSRTAEGGTAGAETQESPSPAFAPPPEVLGFPDPAEQMDALSGILGGLSAAFYHLSDRGRKPGLFEIRQLCESTADRYCAQCPHHGLCWEEDFSATADAMGKITLCVHRKGRAEVSHAFAPLDTRCPSLPSMLAAISEAAAVLCEEKMTKDKMEIAAADYEGMAKLLRAHAEETARMREEDRVLSKRLAGVMGRLGFRAEHLAVYGTRRQTVVAAGIALGRGEKESGSGKAGLRAAAGAEDVGFPDGGSAGKIRKRKKPAQGRRSGVTSGGTSFPGEKPPLLETEDLRAAFSAAAGVAYRAPDYTITEGGRQLYMTLRAEPQLTVECGWWGEKKPGEEVTGDALTVFSDRNDHFHALLCDGMGSGKEASVTAQIASLFLEKLLSVSSAKGAALNLLNTFLRSRGSECSVTVDLCAIDLITAEAHFLKCGASPSYLIRGERLFRIASGTMPLGILREVSAEETSFPLENGDLLLFFSDGVCGDDGDSAWVRKTAAAALMRAEQEERWGGGEVPFGEDSSFPSSPSADAASTADTSPEDGGGVSFTPAAHGKESRVLFRTAELIGEAAKERGCRRDDMTAAVLRVRRKLLL